MAKEREIELAEAIQILVTLFPSQHGTSAAWLKSIRAAGTDPRMGAADDRHGSYGRGPGSAGPKLHTRRPEDPRRSQQRQKGAPNMPPLKPLPPPPPPAPPPLPVFVREVKCDVSEWQSRLPAGIEISWTEENSVRTRIAGLAGLTGWGPGYRSTMLTVKADLMLSGSHCVTVEIVIPRLQAPKVLLVAIAPRYGSEKLFEIGVVDLSSPRIRELGTYVFNTAGVT